MDIMATVYWFRSETKSAKNAASFTLNENLLATYNISRSFGSIPE